MASYLMAESSIEYLIVYQDVSPAWASGTPRDPDAITAFPGGRR